MISEFNVLLLTCLTLIILGEKFRDPIYILLGLLSVAIATINLPPESLIPRWILASLSIYLVVKVMVYGKGFISDKTKN